MARETAYDFTLTSLQGEPMPVVDPIEVMGDPAGKHAKRCLDLADVVG